MSSSTDAYLKIWDDSRKNTSATTILIEYYYQNNVYIRILLLLMSSWSNFGYKRMRIVGKHMLVIISNFETHGFITISKYKYLTALFRKSWVVVLYMEPWDLIFGPNMIFWNNPIGIVQTTNRNSIILIILRYIWIVCRCYYIYFYHHLLLLLRDAICDWDTPVRILKRRE